MNENDQKIKELEERFDRLVAGHVHFQKELNMIRGEIVRLRAERSSPRTEGQAPSRYVPERPPAPTSQPPASRIPPRNLIPTPSSQTPESGTRPISQADRPPQRPVREATSYELPKRTAYPDEPVLSGATTTGDAFSRFVSQYTENARANLEEFVGKNLISLIGIVVLILGVGIGAKYAIDNNLISPTTRIIIGYIFGFGLVGLGIKLKREYHNFSAVIISGGLAIMYFVTYFAYSAYGLIPQLPTFGLMIMFTAFTVAAALVYSRQVIAHIGLVGAYAVPFLLSNDSGNYLALFAYVAVVNSGILAVSLKKDWKPIFYTSSLFTWAIFCGWFAAKYSYAEHFQLALIFLGVFFGIFYATKLVQIKLLQSDDDRNENLFSTIGTAIVFFVMCFAIATRGPLGLPQIWTFFSYLAAFTIAMIATSLAFHKRVFVFYAASLSTWVIFAGWFVSSYSFGIHYRVALTFAGIFFAALYGTTLLQSKRLTNENDITGNFVTSLLNGFVFFSMCYAIMLTAEPGSTQYWSLFTYIAVASIVVLATSFRFFGRAFMYLVVPAVWGIFGVWFAEQYDPEFFNLAATFTAVFFAIFYFGILYQRLVEDNFTVVEHTSLVLVNAFVGYGFGYRLLDTQESLSNYLGLYTAANAALHLIIAFAVSRLKSNAVDVVQVLTILILTFASIAIPVQFDGNAVTIIWATEAAILFWFGRTRGVRLFESYSYPVMVLAVAKLFLDWSVSYSDRIAGLTGPQPPFLNVDFITGIVFVAAFGFIFVTNRDRRYEPAIREELVRPFGIAVGALGTFVLYNMFRIEIGNHFFRLSVNPRNQGLLTTATRPVGDLQTFNILWQINYTIFFLISVAAFNLKKFRSTTLAMVNSTLGVLSMALFLTVSMFYFYILRGVFVAGTFDPAEGVSHWMYIAIRPMSYVLAGVLLYLLYEYSRDPLLEDHVEHDLLYYGFESLAYISVFVVASCELLNLMEQFRLPDGTKLGLSILWGIYALAMIVVGIAKDKKHLRIAAMVLFAVILAKLFFYDIADLDTIPKTILFVTLGITLLIVSFLYNKYKNFIFKPQIDQ